MSIISNKEGYIFYATPGGLYIAGSTGGSPAASVPGLVVRGYIYYNSRSVEGGQYASVCMHYPRGYIYNEIVYREVTCSIGARASR